MRGDTLPRWFSGLTAINLLLVAMVFLSPSRLPETSQAPPPPPPPVPKTKPVDWDGSKSDTDKVPVQVVTLADGHAFFVVGTDTAPWPPLVWLFDVASGKWIRQHGDVPPGVR